MKKMMMAVIVILMVIFGCKDSELSSIIRENQNVDDNSDLNNEEENNAFDFEILTNGNETDKYQDKEEVSEVSEGSEDNKVVHLSKEKGESISLSELGILNENYILPKGYLKDVYWTGNEVLDQVLITHIIRGEYKRNIFTDDVKSQYLCEEDFNKINSQIETYELSMYDTDVRYWKSISYDEYSIEPFFTEYEEYIGIKYIIHIGEFINSTSEEKHEFFVYNGNYEGKYIVNKVYYRKDKDGYFIPDKQGYYKKRYAEKGCEAISFTPGELIFTDEFIDYSYTDYGSEPRFNESYVGYTKWSDDDVLNKALLAFIIYEYSFDKRLCEEYINEYLCLSDANRLNESNKYIRYPNLLYVAYSEINVEYSDIENMYLIKGKLGNEIPESSLPIDSYLNDLEQTFYVIQEDDGKYRVLNSYEFENEVN